MRKQALEKWGDDYEMVVYMINNQADALINLIDDFESDNTSIALKAIKKWSYNGYQSSNIKTLNEIKTFGLKELISIQV